MFIYPSYICDILYHKSSTGSACKPDILLFTRRATDLLSIVCGLNLGNKVYNPEDLLSIVGWSNLGNNV